jgi:predicted nucleic-acid-binding Zn-ribbon protein
MSKSCPKCGGRMEQGFTPEQKQHATSVSLWVEGAPEKSFWSGIKTRGRKNLKIETWRCNRCGYLEGYAPG